MNGPAVIRFPTPPVGTESEGIFGLREKNLVGGRTDSITTARIMGSEFHRDSRARKRSTQRISALFKIKICGISSVKDAQLTGLAGADAVGLNFYEASPRYLNPELAEKVVSVLRPNVARVGVFVDSTAEEINRIGELLQLDYIQLHGDEPPELLTDLSERLIIRAFRYGEEGKAQVADFLERCGDGRRPDAILVDSSVPGEYGGTGQVADWGKVAEVKSIIGGLPLVLAGGLTPFNVIDAIAKVAPDAVDTASGVESQPGNKDPMLVRAFANAAKKAFQKLDSDQT